MPQEFRPESSAPPAFAPERIDLLVIAAHPDDAEMTVGGTLLVARRLGYRTAVVDLTRGELSSRGDLETRARETAAATELLGLAARENLDLPDGGVRDAHEARLRLVGAIRRLRPKLMLAPWKGDLHPDHAGAGLLAERCWYLCGVGKFAPTEAPYRPHLLGFYACHTPIEATAIVDVTPVWEQRLAVMRCYASQFHDDQASGPATKIAQPHFLAALEGRARDLGMRAGCEFGEGLRWEVPALLADPVGFCHEGGPR